MAVTLVTLNIPDIKLVVKDDLDQWVKDTLAPIIAARLRALKEANDDLEASAAKAIIIDDPATDFRGIDVTTGMRA